MISFNLFEQDKPLKILALGAHCDDIEIGCGGSILKLSGSHHEVDLCWVVLASTTERKAEASASAKTFTQNANRLDLKIYDFPDGYLPYHGEKVKNCFEELKQKFNPDLIFTHYRHDLHQDHRLVSELTWNTFRDHLILEYEIPKWDGDLGNPNTFINLDQATGESKIDKLIAAYHSQRNKPWFTRDLFWSLMRIRGMESNSPGGIAEAFYTRKTVLTGE